MRVSESSTCSPRPGALACGTVQSETRKQDLDEIQDRHRRLVDIVADDPEWAWRLEAARQVHASTQEVLKVGAAIDPLDPPTVYELGHGIACAADALIAAIAAGFVRDAADDVRATVHAVGCGGGFEMTSGDTPGPSSADGPHSGGGRIR